MKKINKITQTLKGDLMKFGKNNKNDKGSKKASTAKKNTGKKRNTANSKAKKNSSTKAESQSSDESTDSTQTENKPTITDFLNADTVKTDDEEQLNKTLSHVYTHDVYDTLGVLEDLTKILVEEEDLKAVYEAKKLFTAIKYIKENLAVE